MTSKLAERLSFAVTVAADRVGRAYIKPVYAQAYSPLPKARASALLQQAANWFAHDLEERPPAFCGVSTKVTDPMS